MSLRIALDDNKHLQVWVSGRFDCQLAHALLDRVRVCWRDNPCAVHLDLGGVTQPSGCAIAALVSLSEMLGADFLLESCSEEVETLYVSALMAEYFSSGAGEQCAACLGGKGHAGENAMSIAGESDCVSA